MEKINIGQNALNNALSVLDVVPYKECEGYRKDDEKDDEDDEDDDCPYRQASALFVVRRGAVTEDAINVVKTIARDAIISELTSSTFAVAFAEHAGSQSKLRTWRIIGGLWTLVRFNELE